ncbi:xanthine dehydrogenase family protein molybdopterin-binding subunit [Caballeronia sp. LjRoot34]|uniref:xanthine dehydrogenase family protein molybdopterin-binding subunit n=1 Tax=Caballeronia sp. LjRoot34 TaxID=3342325 RepID=UPI003ECE3D71
MATVTTNADSWQESAAPDTPIEPIAPTALRHGAVSTKGAVGQYPANVDQSPLRRDGDLLVSGRAEFLDDIAPAGLLHATILRSPHPHARIRSIRIDDAERSLGVHVVLTGAQALNLVGPMPAFFEPSLVGCRTFEFRCLAVDVVRWVGQPIAAVVARSLADAEAAASKIVVDYEPLPALLDVEEAAKEGAPRVFPEWDDNLVGTFRFAEGDASAKIAAAEFRFSDEVRVGRHQCAPMETRGYVASWDRAGKLTFWGSTQNPHPLRTNLGTMLGLSEDKIRVVATRLGGGFGHKFNGYAEEPLVCILSKLVGAPVKWLETRAECLLVGARDFVSRFEVGFDRDGRVQGLTARILGNIGALETWGGWTMTFAAAMTYPGPYQIKDYEVQSSPVVTNKAPWNGYRGYGKEQAALALERIMDMISQRLKLDPAEVRRRNFIPSDAFPYWTAAKRLDSGNYVGALDMVLELAGYDGLRTRQREARAAGRHLGIGVAFELTPEGGDFAGSFVRGFDTSTVRVAPSGTVTVLTGVTSPGTGNETSFAQLVARELGIPISMVSVVQGDTDLCPYGFGSFSSRSIATGGAAAVLASREIRDRMRSAAAIVLECDAEDVEFAEGEVRSVLERTKSITFSKLADTIYRRVLVTPGLDQPLLEVTKVGRPTNFHHIPDEKGRFSPYPTFPYSAHVAVVEVDVETGLVKLDSYYAVDDCGVIITPRFVDGQLYGAIAQGIGGALWEELPYGENGKPVAQTLKQYLLPRAPDLPTIHLAHQHTPSPFTLLGTKGAGESGVGGAMAVIANAVNDALLPLGITVHQLPLNPPTVLSAILAGER